MNKTASMVLKIIGASLAFAAVVCLLIGGWHDLSVGYSGMKKRLSPEIRLRVRRLRRRRALRVIQSIKKGPIQMDGALFCVFAATGQQKTAGRNPQPQRNSP